MTEEELLEKFQSLKNWRDYYSEKYFKTGKKIYREKFLEYTSKLLKFKELKKKYKILKDTLEVLEGPS